MAAAQRPRLLWMSTRMLKVTRLGVQPSASSCWKTSRARSHSLAGEGGGGAGQAWVKEGCRHAVRAVARRWPAQHAARLKRRRLHPPLPRSPCTAPPPSHPARSLALDADAHKRRVSVDVCLHAARPHLAHQFQRAAQRLVRAALQQCGGMGGRGRGLVERRLRACASAASKQALCRAERAARMAAPACCARAQKRAWEMMVVYVYRSASGASACARGSPRSQSKSSAARWGSPAFESSLSSAAVARESRRARPSATASVTAWAGLRRCGWWGRQVGARLSA